MSTRLKEKEEKILEILAALVEESSKGTPIVVEGKKDVAALRSLGVEGNVVTAKTGGKSFPEVISEIEQARATEVVLLLDFDRRGVEGTKLLKRSLERAQVAPNVTFWHGLLALVGKEVHCVEGLPAYLETLRAKLSASTRQKSLR